MPTHYCHGLERGVLVPAELDLWSGLMAAGVPIASACQGEGICGRCALLIEGEVPPMADLERRTLLQQGVAPGLRLACCVRSPKPLELYAPYWGVRKS
jgi:2Fe-2S ferredoxin